MNTPPMPGSPGRATLQSTTGRIAAVGTALLLVLFLVLSVSRAAFVDATTNPGNSAATDGFVTLTDDDADFALFTSDDALAPLVGLLPAEVDALLELSAKCISVRYDGEFESLPIKMFATPVGNAVNLGTLAPYLQVKVEMQQIADSDLSTTPNPLHVCDDFNDANQTLFGAPELIFNNTLDQFGSDFDTGVETFPGEQGTFAFKFTMNVKDDPAAKNKAALWNFVWEAQTDDTPPV